MMGDFNEAGLGVYSKNGYTYYTLDLGKRSGVSVPEFSSAAMLAALLSLGLILVVIARKRGSAQE
jgi:hypothetical protein